MRTLYWNLKFFAILAEINYIKYIADKYGVLLSDSPALIKSKVFSRFEESLGLVDAI